MAECNLPLGRASGFFGGIRFGAPPANRASAIRIVHVVMHWMSPEKDDRYSRSPEVSHVRQDDGAPVSPDELAAQLSKRYWERIRLFAARRLRDRALAEDVAQEVIRRALEALRANRVENLDALPAFLFQTARHVCMQRARSAGREGRALERMASGEEESGSSRFDSPLTDLIGEERRDAVRHALHALEPDDRNLLLMSYEETLESAEIGRRLGITSGAVRVRRHRAVRKLAELLGVTNEPERRL
jgi:RNA polymerase sigma-70 factor (ECF subfamily)